MPGKGRGLAGLVRRPHVTTDNIHGISKGDIRRLARRGGVKRLSSSIYDEARATLYAFLVRVIHDSVVYTEFGKRTTVTAMDVQYALKRHGQILYGFNP